MKYNSIVLYFIFAEEDNDNDLPGGPDNYTGGNPRGFSWMTTEFPS